MITMEELHKTVTRDNLISSIHVTFVYPSVYILLSCSTLR